MNAQNKTDTIVIPKFTATPMVAVMNIKQVSAKIIVWPAMMLANRRIISANGFVKIPTSSIPGIIGTGTLSHHGTSAKKISFQYSRVPNRFTARNVHSASTSVTAMLPDTFAPPGKNGISPIRLLTKMKKNTVSR